MNPQKFNISGSIKKIEIKNCELSTEKTEGNLIAVNQKYLALILKSGNDIALVDSSKTMDLKNDQTCLKYDSKILDLEFSPFDNNILASNSLDKSVLLWKIPEDKNKNFEKTPYNKHSNKVYFIDFNPIAFDTLCTSTFNGEIHIWNIEKKEIYAEFKATNYPTLISWNPNGELIGVTANNKNINIFEPRNKIKILQQKISEKNSKFSWIDNTLFSTISWNNNGDRLIKLWDMKKMDKEISTINIGNSINITSPFVNPLFKIIYTVGKGENFINLYDYGEGVLKFLYKYNNINFSNCSVLCDRKGLDKNKLEVDRFAIYSKAINEIF